MKKSDFCTLDTVMKVFVSCIPSKGAIYNNHEVAKKIIMFSLVHLYIFFPALTGQNSLVFYEKICFI